MRYPELTVIGFLSAALVLVPLPHQIRAGNIACIALAFWLFQDCLISAVNSIIWVGNVNNTAPVWCDITSKLNSGRTVALTAASLCICKHLEFISSLRPISSDTIQRRRKIFEVVMCFGIPALWMFLFYCFQNARFVIYKDFGCTPGWHFNDGITALLFGTPLLFSVITLIYGFITLYRFAKNRQTSFHVLPHVNFRDSALSSRQYYRLMAMGISIGIWGVVWIFLVIHLITTMGSYPIPSWKELHKNDMHVIELPTILLGPVFVHWFYALSWGIPGAGFLFFLLFATTYDALYEYVKFWIWFRTTVLRQPLREKAVMMSTLRSQSAPSYHVDTTVVYDDLKSKLPTPPDQVFGSPVLLPPKD